MGTFLLNEACMFVCKCKTILKNTFFFVIFFCSYGKRANVPNYKNLFTGTFEGLNVLTNLYTICHNLAYCILYCANMLMHKCLPNSINNNHTESLVIVNMLNMNYLPV